MPNKKEKATRQEAAKAVKPKKLRVPSLKVQMRRAIIDSCGTGVKYILIDSQKAIMVKRISVTTFSVQEGPFSYKETHKDKTFDIVFCISWDPLFSPSVKIMPEFEVKTPEEAKRIIESYEG